MINNNKILTVSYGTFSCTLEGFDDSFGTMKAIAEYFRDLAADDRYFGAEPPQPDAQMLARIAQREISRHVDARQDDGRIVLSARNTPQAAALVASEVVEDVATAVAEATETKAELAVEDIALPAEADAPQKGAAPDEPEAPAPAEKADVEAPVVARKPQLRITQPTPTQTDAAEDKPDIVPSVPDAEVEAFFTEHKETKPSAKAAPVAEFEDETTAAVDTAKASSIADKLKRIRAVVSQQAEDGAAKDYSEDQHVDATAAKAEAIVQSAEADIPAMDDFAEEDEEIQTDEQSDVLADTLRDLEDAMDADDAVETAEDIYDEIDTEDDNDDIAAILNRLEREADASGDTPAPVTAEDDAYDDDGDDDDDDDMDDNILAVMDSSDSPEDADEDNMFDAADAQSTDDAPEALAAPAPSTPRTRVLKVKRATLEAALQSGMLEEYTDEEEGGDAPAAETLRKAPLAERSTLSEEAEADLARELAELEADIAAKDEEANAEEPALEEVEAPQVEPKSEMHVAPDADVSRLMEETAQQMDEPEAATRRDAFTHLRAAVAAKKADEAVGGAATEVDTGEAYRDDLDQVVRPRRPVSSGRPRSERPAEQRPAPLKLVAEQRIDVSEPRSATPVRPRRVSAVAPTAAPATMASDATNFEDFASEMGAVKLPDLLEAAAAYLSFVEGHEQFSRPQLMSKVRQVEQENFTREDSLRSFGKLLREGKIEKLKGGRFQASDQIGFKPDARAAG